MNVNNGEQDRRCIFFMIHKTREILISKTRVTSFFLLSVVCTTTLWRLSLFNFYWPATNFFTHMYLGVYVNHNLKWDHHIDQVTAKAARKLGFIRRNLRGATAECKKMAYITLVRSGMEYASIIWDPHTNTNSDKLEKNPTFSC